MAIEEAAAALTCFVIGPIGDKLAPVGSEPRDRYEQALEVRDLVILAACQRFGIEAIRADMMARPGEIPVQVVAALRDAPLVIADLTGGNANVMYELGLRHAKGGCVIQIGEYGRLPFDIAAIRTIQFVRTDLGLIQARRDLEAAVEEVLRGNCDKLTATLTMEGSSFTPAVPPSVDSAVVGSEDEGLGFLEILAEMESALPELLQQTQQQTEVMEKLSSIAVDGTSELEVSDLRGDGFAGRSAVVARVAIRMSEQADILEPLVAGVADKLSRIDRGVSYILDTAESDTGVRSELTDFFTQIVGFATAFESAGTSARQLADAYRGMEAAHSQLRVPVRRLAATLGQHEKFAVTAASWRERAARLGGVHDGGEVTEPSSSQ